jgi:CheY-like chemotaxis protein
VRDAAPIRLLIDDRPVVRGGLRGIFSWTEGFEVMGEAANGVEALAEAKRLRADVVLMDLRMPEMGGLEATRRLRERVPSAQVCWGCGTGPPRSARPSAGAFFPDRNLSTEST